MSGLPSDIEADLKSLTFAADWPERLIAEVARVSSRICYPRGAVIFQEGKTDDRVFGVLSGRIALEMFVPARGAVRLMTVSRGDLLGWSPLLGDREMTATAVALEDSQLLCISAANLTAQCQHDPELGFAVMRSVAGALSRRLMATRLQLLDLFSQTAPDVNTTPSRGELP